MPPRPMPRLGLRPAGSRPRARWTGHAYATASGSPPPPPHTAPLQVFDRHAKLLQRERAAHSPLSCTTDYLKDHVAANLAERLLASPPHPASTPARRR